MSRGPIHHIELNVSDLARSGEFWGWLLTWLGYTEYQRWDGGRSWILDHTYIVLVQTEPRFREAGYHRGRTGLNHVAFHVESTAAVEELVAELRARGGDVLYGDRHPHAGGGHHYAAFFEDPDRIKIEIAATPPRA
jgi:catechol 2,3-dioxygenase-like lactoylglutathione lyase family enzyme